MTVQMPGLSTPLIAGDMSFSSNLSPDALMIYLQTRLDGLDAQIDTIFNDQQRQQKAQSLINDIKTELSALKTEGDDVDFDPPGPAPAPAEATRADWASTREARENTRDPLPSDAPTQRTSWDGGTQDPPAAPSMADPRGMSSTSWPGRSLPVDAVELAVGGVAAPPRSQVEQRIDAKLAALRAVDPALADKLSAQMSQTGQLFANHDLKYNGSEVTATSKLLDGIGKDLESQASLNMIRLQSIMSSRQTAVQLATNMVSSLGESTKAIATNVGH